MKRLLITAFVIALMIIPVRGTVLEDYELPVTDEMNYVEDPATFWKDLCSVVEKALREIKPDLLEGTRTCIHLIGIVLLGSITIYYTIETKQIVQLVVTISSGLLLMRSGHSLIELGMETVRNISEYGKLILPALAGALSAQGGMSMSIALYTGTALFSSVLTTVMSKLLIPLLYIFLCLSIACGAIPDEILKQLRSFANWILTWGLKLILYLFTGYMSISGVISGTVDASALKATKLAISGSVPVVGNILSDASETILLSADVMKNSVGVYGLIALMTIFVGPFFKIGIHYLLLKVTAAICSVFAPKETTGVIFDCSSGMGFVLAMTGTSSLLLMISIVCFMKGVG